MNSILPDAILQGSAIWNSNWRNERAAAYGIEPDQLEEHYRKRTTLLVNIYPQDVAEGIAFFASSKADKTTGCMLTIDGEYRQHLRVEGTWCNILILGKHRLFFHK